MLITKEIKEFIFNNLKNTKNLSKYHSYKFELKDVNILTLLDNFTQEDYFYWHNSTKNEQFIALGRIELPLSKKILASNKLINLYPIIKQKINFNYNSENLPIICGAIKFSEESTDLWADFNHYDFFIPKVIIYNFNMNCGLIINTNGKNFNLDTSLWRKIDCTEGNCNENIEPILTGKIYESTDPKYWESIVKSALHKISENKVSKVVLARKKSIALKQNIKNISAAKIFMQLYEKHPESLVFGYKKAGSIFFGATPEKFLSLKGDTIETEALAGSQTNGDNNDLLNDIKNLNEHKQVLDYILEGLKQITNYQQYDEHPKIKDLKYIKHLLTNISAKFKEGITAFDVIEKLFPTPAVCGYPKEQAKNIIINLEKFDRGLYSGIIGYLCPSGNADFYVALRSAIIKNDTLHAYAGCGIVSGSDAYTELKETEYKFIPILSLIEDYDEL
jgi:menaquinone-specific isochorismate synthase